MKKKKSVASTFREIARENNRLRDVVDHGTRRIPELIREKEEFEKSFLELMVEKKNWIQEKNKLITQIDRQTRSLNETRILVGYLMEIISDRSNKLELNIEWKPKALKNDEEKNG